MTRMTIHQILAAAAANYVQCTNAKYEYSWHVSDPDGDPGARITLMAAMPHGLSYVGHYDVDGSEDTIEMTWVDAVTRAAVTRPASAKLTYEAALALAPRYVNRTVDAVLSQITVKAARIARAA
jgi:hypothetical protein